MKNNPAPVSKELVRNIEELYTRVDFHYYMKYDIRGGGLRMALGEPAKRFGDLSYSHPNLNLRMHLISYLIYPTPEKSRRLQWVQEQRKLFFDVNTFTPDVMDGLMKLKILTDDSTSTEGNE